MNPLGEILLSDSLVTAGALHLLRRDFHFHYCQEVVVAAMKFHVRSFFAALFVIAVGPPAGAIEPIRASLEADLGPLITKPENQWPSWRGSHQDGKSRETSPPVEWSETDNVVWRSSIPGRGHSSPIVTDECIFLTTADEEAFKQMAVCLDRATGQHRWTKTVHQGGFMDAHRKNSQASSTPAWDGQQLYTVFLNESSLWVSAIDATGNIVWQCDVGPFKPEHGFGASPALYRSLVIVNGDNKGDNKNDSFIAALDRTTGKIIWRTPRERISSHGNYGSPIVVDIAGKHQLLLAGHGKLTSYNPDTGALIWFCEGPADVRRLLGCRWQRRGIRRWGLPRKKHGCCPSRWTRRRERDGACRLAKAQRHRIRAVPDPSPGAAVLCR